MTEREYNERVKEVFDRLALALDSIDAEIEWDTPNDAVIELGFNDGSKIIINRQAAGQEIWVAAKSGGYHFSYNEGAWRNTRDGSELFEALSRHVSDQAGMVIRVI